jgi:hypothetical protein
MTFKEKFKHLSEEEYEKLVNSMCVAPHDIFLKVKGARRENPPVDTKKIQIVPFQAHEHPSKPCF